MPIIIGGVLIILLVLCAGAAVGYAVLSGGGDDQNGTPVSGIGEEIVPTADDGGIIEQPSPTGPADVPVSPTSVPPVAATATGEATQPAVPTLRPTSTPVSLPPTEQPPTVPPPAATAPAGLSVRINGITVQDGRYVVVYETFGYTENWSGPHVHFFFDTVSPENAGVPGSGPWILYGGPRPFTEYAVSARPGPANRMCALVANADHSVQLGSGNCVSLPSG